MMFDQYRLDRSPRRDRLRDVRAVEVPAGRRRRANRSDDHGVLGSPIPCRDHCGFRAEPPGCSRRVNHTVNARTVLMPNIAGSVNAGRTEGGQQAQAIIGQQQRPGPKRHGQQQQARRRHRHRRARRSSTWPAR